MISRFFIDRPVFACVLSILITLAGGISVFVLPLAQFPPISPPNVAVSCNYPGASAKDVAGSVAAPIEEYVNGVEGMLYMSSSCTNDGSYNLTVTFKHGVDLNMARVLVQNRVSLAIPKLPDVIKQTGVLVKRAPDVLMGIAITSPDRRYDQLYLSNYAITRIKDELSRVPGVSDIMMMGQRDYSIRIWVNPAKLASLQLTAGDVVRAVREQNIQVATGVIGSPPIRDGQQFEITLTTTGRLVDVEEFEDIIVKSTPDGRIVRVKDIGSVKLGAKSEDLSVVFDGKPTVFMPIFQLPDANALDTHELILAKMEDLAKDFPEGLIWEINFDTTPYTSESIKEVFKALRDAIILVAVVVLVFLQNWRSSLIPLVAVPVAVVGTFAAMAVFGFSLNNLTLFGLVLAIGIVVDDAIVVVEAVEHHIESGLAPRDATILAMKQVSGPVIAVGLVLSAVFVPCAFISGITGQFFRQFALTISVSTIISAFNSLTLSPALTALLLRPRGNTAAPPLPWLAFVLAGGWFGWDRLPEYAAHYLPSSGPLAEHRTWVAAVAGALAGAIVAWPVNRILSLAFRAFNRGFEFLGSIYTWTVGKLLHVTVLVFVVYAGLLGVTYQQFLDTPKGFIPSQDMGYLLINVQLPDSASDERTSKVLRKIEKLAASVPGIKHVTGVTGQSFALNALGSNFGSLFIGLDDYDKRRDPKLLSTAIVAELNERFKVIDEAMVQVFPPPPVRGVGRAGGFTLMVEDRGDAGLNMLQAQAENLVAMGNAQPQLANLFAPFRANVPMLSVDPNLRECMEKGVNLKEFADTLQIYQGSLYVNDFNLFGRTWQVIVQSEQRFRDQVEDIPKLMVRNAAGTMVPLGSLANIREINGPLVLTRYNMYPAASITGAAKPGVSSRDALDLMQKLADAELPPSMAFEWTEMAFLELMAGNTAMIIFGFAVVMVFLVLAAQYESWSLPLAVILVVPMCLLSAVFGVNVAQMDINIFTQIGFVVLVGLASKNAILIVEFAKMKREAGESRRQATLEACRLRLRPIVMTSFAFILGAVPLILAQGAGAEMRRTLGTAVFSGMLGVTIFGVFLTPIFFFALDWLGGTPVFASRVMHHAGQWSLGLITLKPLRALIGHVRSGSKRPRTRNWRRRNRSCRNNHAVFSNFFINRPIFASVLSIVITLGGGIALFTLPIAQYPDITPPTVEVSASYPGANAQVVADTVAAPIEQQVNGVENMLYMSSQCANDGTYILTVTFKNGVDLNMAQVLVQNRVALAQPILPSLVQRRGVSVKKKSPSVLMIVNLFSTGGTRDSLYLSNYATIQLKDELSRLPGVGDITYLGQRDYSMRLWLDPEKMASRNLSTTDVVQAIEQQNTQVAAGQIGQPPVKSGQVFQFTISTMGRLTDPEQFAEMILKTDTTGRLVRLQDVARIELGAQGYDQTCTLDGRPSVALSIYQLPGSNALEIAQLVRSKMEELKGRFPEGVDYAIVYDTTPFITESINEVFKGLRDAVILVAIVVLVFLQNWRSAIIPLVAVPVAIVGTFAVMAAMGFSLNNLTLFGLVLAIGIVVDDAIVVVEAVEHHIEHGLSPRDATIRAMEQVSGPVIAVGLVFSAVFVPCAFITGIMGEFFKQFALTIAVSMMISTFNSLTLSPALTALLLRPRDKGSAPPLPWLAFVVAGGWLGWQYGTPWIIEGNRLPGVAEDNLLWIAAIGGAIAGGVASWPLNRILGFAFRAFNKAFDLTGVVYTWTVGRLLRVSLLVLVGYGALLQLTYTTFAEAPKGFIPTQDKGYLLVNLQLPDSASVGRTEEVMQRIEKIALATPGIRHTVAISGQSILLNANAPNFGAMFVMLDDFHERLAPELSGDALAAQLQRKLQEEIAGGLVNVLGAPPLEGLGTAGGFKVMIEDRGNSGLDTLQQVADHTVIQADKTPELENSFTSFRHKTPWLYLDIDRTAAKAKGVSVSDIFNTLQVYLGSLYVNDFNLFGRTWQVNVQADQNFREQIADLKQLKVRNTAGQMVPFGTLATVRDVSGPVLIARYNMYPSAPVNSSPGPGVSSGQAIEQLERVVNENLTPSMRFEWTELALLQLQTGNTALLVLLLAVVLVFLVLAAQYESWSLPLAVILVVPMCLLCSVAAVVSAQMDINIFTQVGFVVLIGLACKNAILVVEFARAQREAGKDRYQATLDACKLRLRPIVMTSFAFILGVVPLVLAVGAGSEMRRTLGTAVFGGMLGVTLFGIFLTPVFYYVIEMINDIWRARRSPKLSRLVQWLRTPFRRLSRQPVAAEPAGRNSS